MRLVCIVLWLTSQVGHVEPGGDGWLIFMSAGSDVPFNKLWDNSSYSDATDLYGHQQNRFELIQNGEIFRSPLIDRIDELDVNNIELVIYNKNLGFMGSFTVATDGSSFDYVVDDNNNVLLQDFGAPWGASLYFYNVSQQMAFLSLHMNSGIAGLYGEQFIISVNETTEEFEDAVYLGCFQVMPEDGLNVRSVFDCTIHCLTQSGCTHIGMYWNDTRQEIMCLVLTGKPPISSQGCYASGGCDEAGTMCIMYSSAPPLYVNAEVYEVMNALSDKIQLMKAENTATVDRVWTLGSDAVIEYSDPLFVIGVQVNAHNTGTFTLTYSLDECQAVLSDPRSNDVMFDYIMTNAGTIRKFDTGISAELAPTKFRCLYFNSTQDLENSKVTLHLVAGETLLAQYIGIYGEWSNEPCSTIEMMDRPELIPDEFISIPNWQLEPEPIISIFTPNEFKLNIRAKSNDSLNTWIKNIEIASSTYLHMSTLVTMNCLHSANGPRNMTYTYELTNATTAGSYQSFTVDIENSLESIHYFCRAEITIKLVPVKSISENLDTYGVIFRVKGCIVHPDLPDDDICFEENLIDNGALDVTLRRNPRKYIASNALRPGGRGLSIQDFPMNAYINITLHDTMDINVTQVIITGQLLEANVLFGNVTNTGNMNLDAVNCNKLDYQFNGVMGKTLYITGILPEVGLDPWMTVAIFACNFSTPEGVSDSVSPTTTSTATSTTTSTSVLPTQSTPPSVLPTQSTPPTVHPTQSTPPTVHPTLSTPPTVHPTLSTPPTVHPTLSTPPTVHPTLSTPPTVHPTLSTPPTVHPTLSTPPTVHPTQSTPPLVQSTQSSQPTTQPTPPSTHSVQPTQSSTHIVQQTVSHSPGITSKSPPPAQNCLCNNVTNIVTEEELEEAIAELQEKLIVPAKTTSSFKRTKTSAPDKRTSSKVIGTVGAVTMVMAGLLVVAMDIGHIINAFNFVKALLGLGAS